MDTALPGPHTRMLYDSLSKLDASILSRARTNKSRLASYLYTIGALGSPLCPCGRADQDLKHVLFRCRLFADIRTIAMKRCPTKSRGDLSLFLGGRPAHAQDPWFPVIPVVIDTIEFLKKTGLFTEEQVIDWSQSIATTEDSSSMPSTLPRTQGNLPNIY